MLIFIILGETCGKVSIINYKLLLHKILSYFSMARYTIHALVRIFIPGEAKSMVFCYKNCSDLL
jgi:cytochrome b subunit of formate dehydrogenase